MAAIGPTERQSKRRHATAPSFWTSLSFEKWGHCGSVVILIRCRCGTMFIFILSPVNILAWVVFYRVRARLEAVGWPRRGRCDEQRGARTSWTIAFPRKQMQFATSLRDQRVAGMGGRSSIFRGRFTLGAACRDSRRLDKMIDRASKPNPHHLPTFVVVFWSEG